MKRTSLRIWHAVLWIGMLTVLLALSACDSAGSSGKDTADTTDYSQPPLYVIVRADDSNEEEKAGAVRLRTTIRDTFGIDIPIETDWIKRGEDVENHRFTYEIVFGDTNRNESIAAYAALKEGTAEMVDYTLTNAGNHYIIAASAGNVDDAVTQFLSYIEEDPSMLYRAPEEMNDIRVHDFPLDDITVMGESLSAYEAIVYPAAYDQYFVRDVQRISDLIFEGIGTRLPIVKDNSTTPPDGKVIRIGARADEGVLAAGDFSYSMDITDHGIHLDAQDMYGDTRAMEALTDLLSAGIAAGGTLALDDADDIRLENPADKPRIEIAAWVISSPDMETEAQFAEIRDCGFNMVIIQKTSDGELFHNHCKWLAKSELQALWHDGDTYVPNAEEDAGDIDGASYITIDPEGYVSCDITWGNMLRDEPSASLFQTLAEAYDAYDAITDDKIPYINLFPSYANEEQLGTPTYEEHLKQFFDTVDPQLYTSVDIYPLNTNSYINSDYFYNLDVFATECRTRGIPFAVYIQSVSFHSTKRTPDEQEMRWQAYCALSFGAQNIEYFTYRTPNSSTEDFKDALIARSNEKTDGWFGAQSVNAALNLMSDAFMQYKNLGAYTVNPTDEAFMRFRNQYTEFDAIADVTVSRDKPVLIGAFASETAEHSRAFTCVNLGDPGLVVDPITVTVELTNAKTATMYYKDAVTTLTPDENGCISFTLAHGDGAFITLGE